MIRMTGHSCNMSLTTSPIVGGFYNNFSKKGGSPMAKWFKLLHVDCLPLLSIAVSPELEFSYYINSL